MLTVDGGIIGQLSTTSDIFGSLSSPTGITGELSVGHIAATYTDDGDGNITISSAASASGGDIILEVT